MTDGDVDGASVRAARVRWVRAAIQAHRAGAAAVDHPMMRGDGGYAPEWRVLQDLMAMVGHYAARARLSDGAALTEASSGDDPYGPPGGAASPGDVLRAYPEALWGVNLVARADCGGALLEDLAPGIWPQTQLTVFLAAVIAWAETDGIQRHGGSPGSLDALIDMSELQWRDELFGDDPAVHEAIAARFPAVWEQRDNLSTAIVPWKEILALRQWASVQPLSLSEALFST